MKYKSKNPAKADKGRKTRRYGPKTAGALRFAMQGKWFSAGAAGLYDSRKWGR